MPSNQKLMQFLLSILNITHSYESLKFFIICRASLKHHKFVFIYLSRLLWFNLNFKEGSSLGISPKGNLTLLL